MPSSDRIDASARQLLHARADARLLPPLTQQPDFSLADGYAVARRIAQLRLAQGDYPVGRKILFPETVFPTEAGPASEAASVSHLVWAPLFDDTVRYATDSYGVQSLAGALAPRINPQIVFKLARTPRSRVSAQTLGESVEWIAPALEVMICPYPDWQFEAADAAAAFGLHGTLIVGEPKMLSTETRHNLAAVLAAASVSLSTSEGTEETLCAAGFGNVLAGSPVHALLHLIEVLQAQQAEPLGAGELIATGALTAAFPVHAGQTWRTAFSGIALEGLALSFV